MKKIILRLLFVLMLACSMTYAQSNSDSSRMSVNEQLVFNIDASSLDQAASTYTVDVSKLNFSSEERLHIFCKSFSWEFHKLTGDFKNHKITVELNKAALAEKNYDVEKLNKHFASISRRMQYIFNKQNK